MFDAVAFAGGGNRCYWQGGFWEAAAPALGLKPALVTGVSGGAFHSAYALIGKGHKVRPLVLEACRTAPRNFEPGALFGGGAAFPVGVMYRQLLATIFDAEALAALQALTDHRIAIARPPRLLPPVLAAAIGIGAYNLEKKLFAPVHPKLGRRLGYRPEFIAVRDCKTPDELVDALMASASVPPFMPLGMIGGRVALDGGLVDNVPVEPLEPIEAQGGRTLVLLTRHYKLHPVIPGRTYLEPSAPIPVGQFDITNPQGILAAYEMGLRDGKAFARRQLGG